MRTRKISASAPKGETKELKPLKMQTLKYCRQCHKNLPLKLFRKSKRTKDGHSSPCKYCVYIKRNFHSPSVAVKIDTLISEARKKSMAKPLFPVDCYHGDYKKTKLYNNWGFVSGDGGYQDHINTINIIRG